MIDRHAVDRLLRLVADFRPHLPPRDIGSDAMMHLLRGANMLDGPISMQDLVMYPSLCIIRKT
jgi:hypothetical protein